MKFLAICLLQLNYLVFCCCASNAMAATKPADNPSPSVPACHQAVKPSCHQTQVEGQLDLVSPCSCTARSHVQVPGLTSDQKSEQQVPALTTAVVVFTLAFNHTRERIASVPLWGQIRPGPKLSELCILRI